MFLLNFLSGKMAGRAVAVRHFPFHVGRSAGDDLVMDDPGVWTRHLTFTREGNLCAMTVLETASAAVNGESVRRIVLGNGDQIAFGGVKLRFDLAPVRLRGLRVRETVVWTALGAVFAVQFWLIYRLLG